MKEIILSAIGDTIKNFEEKIAQAQTLWEKVQIFFDTYKVWILVGLVVLVGIIFFVNIMEAKKRKDDRDNKNNSATQRKNAQKAHKNRIKNSAIAEFFVWDIQEWMIYFCRFRGFPHGGFCPTSFSEVLSQTPRCAGIYTVRLLFSRGFAVP